MKKFMQTAFGRRLFPAIGLLALSVLLGIALEDGFTGEASQMWQRGVFCLAVLGTGLGSLLYFLVGWLGLLGSYAFILLLFLPRALSEPYNRYFALVYFAALLLIPLWKKRKKKNAPSEKEEEEELPDEEELDLPRDVVLVRFNVSDRNYQLIRVPGKILAYRVGGELRGIVPELVQDPAKPLRPLGKQDLEFPVDENLSVTFKEREDQCFEEALLLAKLRTAKRSYTMFPALPCEEENERLRRFMEMNVPKRENKIK